MLKASYAGSQDQGEAPVALPVWLTIPDLNVKMAKVIGLGLSDGQYPASADLPKGSLDTYPLNSVPGEAGWYDQGVRPGAYPKSHFPTGSVYGATGDSELRLIGCGGDYDTATGHYLDNTIVYATLVT